MTDSHLQFVARTKQADTKRDGTLLRLGKTLEKHKKLLLNGEKPAAGELELSEHEDSGNPEQLGDLSL